MFLYATWCVCWLPSVCSIWHVAVCPELLCNVSEDLGCSLACLLLLSCCCCCLQSTKLTEKEKKRAKAFPVRKFALKA